MKDVTMKKRKDILKNFIEPSGGSASVLWCYISFIVFQKEVLGNKTCVWIEIGSADDLI